MSCYTPQHTFYGGLDGHVAWMYCCGIAADGEVRLHTHLRTNPQACLQAVHPCREAVGGCVEGRFTWAWLAARGADEGLAVVLGQALFRRAMHGGTAQNGRSAAHTRAARRRGGRMPQASVYPRRMRARRERFRRRQHLLHTRAELAAHIPPPGRPSTLGAPVGRLAKPQHRPGRRERFAHACVPQHSAVDLALVDGDAPRRAALARSSEQTAHRPDPGALARVRTSPGGGNSLALVRRYASQDSARFPRLQEVVSSGRLVTSAREAQGTRPGTSGQTSANAQLQGAFADAAGLLLKHNAPAHKSRATLATTHGQGQALSIPAHTPGRAVSFLRTQPVACDQAQCLAPEGGRERTTLASTGSQRGKRPPPSHRTER